MSLQTTKLGIWSSVPILILQDPAVTQNGIRVYIALASFQGQAAGCWPSLEAIAERAGIARDAVPKATSALVAAGWIEKKRHGMGKPNTYTVLQKSEPVTTQEVRTVPTPEVGTSHYSRSQNGSDCKTTIIKTTKRKHQNTPAAVTGDVPTETALAVTDQIKPAEQGSQKPAHVLARQIYDAMSHAPETAMPFRRADYLAAVRIAKDCIASFPADPGSLARAVLSTYREMRDADPAWFGKFPWTPCALSSTAVLSRVMQQIKTKGDTHDRKARIEADVARDLARRDRLFEAD